MKGGKFRILHLCEHPVQYNTILWQKQARHPQLDILVVYCSLRGALPAMNPGFGVEVAWMFRFSKDIRGLSYLAKGAVITAPDVPGFSRRHCGDW